METGTAVWLSTPSSPWGWMPAIISNKEIIIEKGRQMTLLTLVDDADKEDSGCVDVADGRFNNDRGRSISESNSKHAFTTTLVVDPNVKDHPQIKLRNQNDTISDNVPDLISLTHLHEPSILHSLKLRYDSNEIYTNTGCILIAVNPFKSMEHLYGLEVMEMYRVRGDGGNSCTTITKPTAKPGPKSKPYVESSGSIKSMYSNVLKKSDHAKKLWGSNESNEIRSQQMKKTTQNSRPKSNNILSPHPYKTADDAYRAMMRGVENEILMGNNLDSNCRSESDGNVMVPTNQSILVSGESGAGKTVTVKIILNYFAMLSKKITVVYSQSFTRRRQSFSPRSKDGEEELVCIEQQVLQSNPILEAFGNARTLRNDNSSRFGKYIDIRFTNKGKLSGASIETYLLEKVRLIHPSEGERNYHVFYQFLSRASPEERRRYMLDEKTVRSPSPKKGRGFQQQSRIGVEDFVLLNQTGVYDRRDKVCDGNMHDEMLEAMLTIGFTPETIHSLMRLIAAILHCGNMTFTSTEHKNARGHADGCHLDKTPSAEAAAKLLGVTFEDLASALTTRAIRAGNDVIHTSMDIIQSKKACEALMKATYGAAFDFIVAKVNANISSNQPQDNCACASIGVLDIFGFETFESNNFEQICINYTNEALQQQFNKYVFKLEQAEYEREGILWKFISFPDNQEVLDLIDKRITGVFATLDEQCIVPSTDQKFTRFLYTKCEKHPRFGASAGQKAHHKFTIEHYAGPVEYNTESWLEKNKDQMPSASVELVKGANFELLGQIQKYIRAEREGRGSVASKTVAAQFCSQLRELRSRINTTVPHYIRCLKPNDELIPDCFEPKMIVEQLRCGGVLEAVRVSRAGYPTRYPHDVFKARYSFLGDRESPNIKPLRSNTLFGKKLNSVNGDASIKKLIGKIALDIWEAERKSKEPMEDPVSVEPQKQPRQCPSNNKSSFISSRTAFLSEPERQDSFRKNKLRNTETHKSGPLQPKSSQEFLALDFSSRCALAGMQVGRTKVFLRREAFDRIEALRASKFGKAAVTIQKIVRGVKTRAHHKLGISSTRQPLKTLNQMCSFSSMRDEYMRTASTISVDSRNDSEGANEPQTTELRTLKSVEGKFQVWPPLKSSNSEGSYKI